MDNYTQDLINLSYLLNKENLKIGKTTTTTIG